MYQPAEPHVITPHFIGRGLLGYLEHLQYSFSFFEVRLKQKAVELDCQPSTGAPSKAGAYSEAGLLACQQVCWMQEWHYLHINDHAGLGFGTLAPPGTTYYVVVLLKAKDALNLGVSIPAGLGKLLLSPEGAGLQELWDNWLSLSLVSGWQRLLASLRVWGSPPREVGRRKGNSPPTCVFSVFSSPPSLTQAVPQLPCSVTCTPSNGSLRQWGGAKVALLLSIWRLYSAAAGLARTAASLLVHTAACTMAADSPKLGLLANGTHGLPQRSGLNSLGLSHGC